MIAANNQNLLFKRSILMEILGLISLLKLPISIQELILVPDLIPFLESILIPLPELFAIPRWILIPEPIPISESIPKPTPESAAALIPELTPESAPESTLQSETIPDSESGTEQAFGSNDRLRDDSRKESKFAF